MKRGQAAMEFLMTYGWAILVVLIAIGALAYFGVINPERFLPSSCTLAPGLACEEWKVSGTTVTLKIRNGMGSDLTINNIALDVSTPSGITATYNNDCTSITAGATCTATFGLSSTGTGKFQATINVDYKKSGEELNHTITGTLTTKFE